MSLVAASGGPYEVLAASTLQDAEHKRCLIQEARAVSAFTQSEIVPIHDVGSDNEIDCLATEIVRGLPFSRL